MTSWSWEFCLGKFEEEETKIYVEKNVFCDRMFLLNRIEGYQQHTSTYIKPKKGDGTWANTGRKRRFAWKREKIPTYWENSIKYHKRTQDKGGEKPELMQRAGSSASNGGRRGNSLDLSLSPSPSLLCLSMLCAITFHWAMMKDRALIRGQSMWEIV